MLATAWYAALASSLLLRTSAFVFLRWIPGHHFPPLVWTLFALYAPAFFYTLRHTSPFVVLEDTIAVTTIETSPADADDVDPRYADPAASGPGEEIIVEEDIALAIKDPQYLLTLLTGLPSPSSALASIGTFLVNLLLAGMVADLVYRAPLLHPATDLSFARVGYVSDTTAKVLVREPDLTQLPVFLSYRFAAHPHDSWKAGGRIDLLDNSTDFTDVLTLTGLRPDTPYEYTVSSNHTGTFTTAPRVGRVSTLADAGRAFTFVHSSCVKLNFPYHPLAHPLSSKGFQYLNTALQGIKAQFMLFLGDFIYADVPYTVGKTAEDYRLQYRQVYASPDWPAAASRVPSWIHVYDDHEIHNDWSANESAPFPAAFDAYAHYHTAANPPPVRPGVSYFEFTQGPASFFMLDTRRYRSPNSLPDILDEETGQPAKSMLGATQRADLLAWLSRPEAPGVRWKILVSSVPFTRNWRLTASDTWAGFLAERDLLLEAMWDASASSGTGIVVLSGDRHEFAATAFPPPVEGKEEIIGLADAIGIVAANPFGAAKEALRKALSPSSSPSTSSDNAPSGLRTRKKFWPQSATVHEFSASPLNMFYLPVRTYHESSTSSSPFSSSSGSSSSGFYESDVCIKYLPDGNSKFGAVSILDPGAGEQSVLRYRLWVDGVEKWEYTLTAGGVAGGKGLEAIWGGRVARYY